jgi:hypothetical protein
VAGVVKASECFQGVAHYGCDLLAVRVRHVMVQLGRQREQRAAPRSPHHDLPQQVTGQLPRDYDAGYPQQASERLPSAGHPAQPGASPALVSVRAK